MASKDYLVLPTEKPVLGNEGEEEKVTDAITQETGSARSDSDMVHYRLYRRRFAGLIALVWLNIVGGMAWPWFGPISNNLAREFDISLTQVNWLGNVMACVYLPVALLIPPAISRYGIRRCCDIGGAALVISAWIRFAGTARSLPPGGAYTLLFLGQVVAGIAQPIFQVMGPVYSQTWFDLKGRTTATMIVGIANPFGGAIGQLISPLIVDTRKSILVLGAIVTAIAPLIFLIGNAPPTPPTYAGSQKTPSLTSLCRATLGLPVEPEAYMTLRERWDFVIIVMVYGVLVGASVQFSILSAQIMQPAGYTSDESGFLGACMLLTGMLAAAISAPLFDRVLTYRLALATKVMVPFVGVGWFVLIWAVRPNNLAALFVIMAVIGICSIPMIPVGMELCCEVTRNADGSAAIVWFAGNLFGIIFVLASDGLRASADASPPLNMKRATIFMGIVVIAVSSSIFFLKGQQKRKQMDEEKAKEALNMRLNQRSS